MTNHFLVLFNLKIIIIIIIIFLLPRKEDHFQIDECIYIYIYICLNLHFIILKEKIIKKKKKLAIQIIK